MMPNQEKVLHGLDSCGFYDGIPNICEVTECPYRDDKCGCVHELAHDAGLLISELLKAQEPIETRLHLCESCKKQYPECDATKDGVVFGSGTGNDNIIGCTAYVNRWKAQEPRLVIEADFENADDYNYIPAWCEERIGGAGYWEMITPGALEEKDFRYWTSKPSLKQMEETPWEKECISKQALS